MNSGQITLPNFETRLNWSVSQRSKYAGQASGDGYLICHNDRVVMFALADGSGSGEEAAAVSNTCLKALGKDVDFDLKSEFSSCHSALKKSRGAALGVVLVDFSDSTCRWAAIGDIDGILVRAGSDSLSETMIQRGGILGVHLPTLHEQKHEMKGNDLIVMTSDGINRNYRGMVRTTVTTEQATSQIMADFANPSDDSTVLAISMALAP